MKLHPILTRAIRLARKGNYHAAIKTLEPEVNRFHDSFRYYYILGVACLRVNDFMGALTYFKLAREVKIQDPNVRLGMAVLHLRRGETDRAVDLYLDVQETDPKNPVARKALAIIRRYAGQNRFAEWLESGEIHRLYPPLPRIPPDPGRLLVSSLVILGIAGIAFILLLRFHVIYLPGSRGPRLLVSGTALEQEDRRRPVESEGDYYYDLSPNQVLEYYDRGLSLFTEYRDEAARLCFNRIVESNAAEGIKNKARQVMEYLAIPGFDTFKRQDNYSYGEVLDDPLLYQSGYVIWQGTATNVFISSPRTSFDFLVEYDIKSMKGIVGVDFDRAVAINPERPLELLARIVRSTDPGGFRLEGIAIHQSILPVQNP
jgi:tetratricopeptide (TPR) repeat protein